MRGENIGHAYLYEVVPHTLPAGKWGYLYWDALNYLKNRGVKHIVIAFPQITTDSVLNLVEQHNQIAKEIGKKTWLYWGKQDLDTYPGVGHPLPITGESGLISTAMGPHAVLKWVVVMAESLTRRSDRLHLTAHEEI